MHQKLHLYFPETERIILPEQSVIAGRANTCDLNLSECFTLSSNVISREHFKVFYDNGWFFILDLHSRGGTKVNHFPLLSGQAHRLEDNDKIEIAGNSRLIIQVRLESDANATQPLPPEPELLAIAQHLSGLKGLTVLGIAGTGKTTLLNKLVYHPETQTQSGIILPEHRYLVFFYVNCMAIDTFTPASFLGLLIAATKPAFYDWPATIRECYNRVIATDCSLAEIEDAVCDTIRTIHHYHRKHVVFLLDQFDDVYPRLLPEKTFPILKNIQQRFADPRVLYVAAMRNPFQESEYIHQFLRETTPDAEYWMPRFSQETLRAMCVAHTLSLEETALSLRLGGGQPRLTELVATVIHNIPVKPGEAALISQLLSNHYIADHCRAMWQSLLPSEQEALISVSHGMPGMTYAVEKRLTQDKWLLNDDEADFTFVSPLFEAYVKSLLTMSVTEVDAGLWLDEDTQEFVLDGQHIPHEDLSKLECDLLLYLYRQAGRVCSRYDISEQVWQYGDEGAASDEMIASVISRLRKKLDNKSSGAGERYIISVRGQGYKCVVK